MSARTTQPQGTARVDWGNPITQGLRLLFNGGTGTRELVRGVAPGSGTVQFTPGRNGQAFNGNGSSRVMDFGALGSIASLTGGATLMAVVDFPATGATTSTICSFVDGSGVRSVSLHANDGTNSNLVGGGYNNVSTWTAYVSPNGLTAGRRYVVIATYNTNTTLQSFEVNDVGTTTSAITFALGEACSIGARRTAPSTYNSYFNGNIYMVGLWARQMTRQERAALAANPWQLMAGVNYPAIVTMPVATGATVYRPGSDLIVNGWTPSTGSDLFAMLDETTLDRGDYITSPNLTSPVTMGWTSGPLAAGTYDIAVDFDRTGATGQLRIVLLDSGGSAVGTSSWQAAPASAATTTFNVTTTGASDRFRIEVQS